MVAQGGEGGMFHGDELLHAPGGDPALLRSSTRRLHEDGSKRMVIVGSDRGASSDLIEFHCAP